MIAFLSTLKRHFAVALVLAALMTMTGCGREEVRAYRVPKEQPRAMPALAGLGPGEQIQWVTPAGWEKREPGGMRAARLVVMSPEGPAADVSVMALPGVSASRKDIVNLWRDQMKLSPVGEGDLPGLAEKVEIAGAPGELFEFVSTERLIDDKQKARILVAMLNRPGTTWFFKMTGEDGFVGGQKAAFLDFLKSVSFTPAAPGFAQAGGGAGAAPSSAPGADSVSAGAKPQWEVPSGWREVPPTQMLLAKFQIGAGEKAAEVSVSAFPGDVGGVHANVNRWRNQLGLEPVAAGEVDGLLSPLDVMGGKAMLVDMTGQKGSRPTRLIGIMVPRGGQTWFYKLMGDAAAAEQEKAAFIKFVQSVRYSNA